MLKGTNMTDYPDPKVSKDLEEAEDALDEVQLIEELPDEELDGVAGGWRIKQPKLKPVVDILNDGD